MTTIRIDYQTSVDQAVADIGKVNEAVGGKTPTAVQSAVGAFTELKAKLDLASMAFGVVKGAVESTINPVIDYAKNIRDLSAFTGTTIEESSELVNVADDLGLEFRTLQVGAKNLAEEGIQPNIKNIAALSDEFVAIQDPVERSQFLMDKFGSRAGTEFAYMLGLGGDALLAMAEDAHTAGLVIGQDVVDSARAAEIAMDDWGDAVLAVKIALSESLLPAVTTTVSAGADWITMWRLNTEALQEGKINLLEWAAAGAEVTLTGETLEGKIDELRTALEEQDVAATLAAHTLRENYEPAAEGTTTATVDYTVAVADNVVKLESQDQWLRDLASVSEDTAGAVAHQAEVTARAAEKQRDFNLALEAGLSGVISDAHATYTQTIKELGVQVAETTAQIAEYERLNGQSITVVQEATASAAEYELAQIKLVEAQTTLNEFTGDSREEFLQLQLAVEKAQEKVNGLGQEMGYSNTFTLDYTQKLADANLTLDELQAKQVAAQQALRATTTEFLFQQIAANADAGAQLEVAHYLGLIDDESYNAAIAIQDLTTKYDLNKNGIIDANEATKDWLTELGNVKSGIDAIPTDHTFTIHFAYDGMAPDQAISDAMNAGGNTPTPFAHGGDYGPGGPLLVGEQGPEIIWPQLPGSVMNNQDLSRMVSALETIAAQGMGTTVNYYGGGDSGLAHAMAGAL